MNPVFRPAVFIHDGGVITDVDDAGCAMFRCQRDQMIGRPLLDFVPGEFIALTKIRLKTTKQGKGTNIRPRIYDFLRCDGSVFVAEVSSKIFEGGLIETTVKYWYDAP